MGKNIIMLSGSPRKGGNTDMLAAGLHGKGEIAGRPALDAARALGRDI